MFCPMLGHRPPCLLCSKVHARLGVSPFLPGGVEVLKRKRLRFGHGGEAVPRSPAGPRTPSNKCPKVLLVPGLRLHSVTTLMSGRGQDAWRDVCDVH